MGRSKFPGKPPKTVTRKRIKVLGRPEAAQSDSVTVAENIYYGLSHVNEIIGDNEKEHPPFHGFSSKEAKLSASYIKSQQRDAEKQVVVKSNGTVANDVSKEDIQNLSPNTENQKNDDECLKIPTDSTIVTTNDVVQVCEQIDDEDTTKKPKVCKNVKFKRVVRTPVLKSVNNILDRHQRTRQLRNSTAKRLLQRAKCNMSSSTNRHITIQSSDKPHGVKKFVLPMRSAHSSRVIKPNKRFIEELEETPTTDSIEPEVTKHTKKAKIVTTKSTVTRPDDTRDLRTKSKKNAQSTNTETSISAVKIRGFADNVQSDRNEYINKKSLNSSSKSKITGKIVCNSTETSKSQESNNVLVDNKQISSIPSKVLPDSIVPIVESSRIQTRSGLLSESVSIQNSSTILQDTEKSDAIISRSTNEVKTTESISMMTDDVDDVNHSNNHLQSDSSLSESGSEQSNNSEDEQSEWTGMKLDGGKVILRKARLKLENKNSGGPEGPFSVTNVQNNSTGNINPGTTGTVKCGVCGAVRFYRFVKQARKFGIYSCESCRKFISKIIKRQACAKSANNTLPVLQCHKGDGLCLVPPVVRSQQWNLMRCVYKTRCPACWLKMCLKCYNIPTTIKAELNTLLPISMKDPVISLGSLSQDDPDVIGQKTIGSKISWPAEDSLEKNLFKSAISWSGIETGRKSGYQSNVQGLISKKRDKLDCSMTLSLTKKRKKDTRIKVRKKMKNPHILAPPTPVVSTPSVTSNQPTQPPRQRVDLKGPRVKHVCRSASVALGQPIATFPTIDGKDETVDVTNKSTSKVTKDEDKSEKPEEMVKDKEVQKSNQENNVNSSNNTIQQSYTKRTKTQQNVLAPNHQMVRALPKSTANTIHEISMDFWEQYDPVEVGAKGFALIASEIFPIPAICYLCGSAGKEPLIHCQCCCEPYHTYCLEPSEWNVCGQPNWCCPRCTTCQTCHLRTGPKLSCIRCRQSFHHSCLSKSGVNARLYSPDRPYVCQSCVKCKSCGSEGVNVYVGNLPLCSMCFKLRQRGNYCPLCQRCYNENDFDTKMMECNECSCWVHARCEGLSDEHYQLLSSLPDSVEFNCSQCSPNPNSTWRNAIESELKAGFIAVIKSLSKNRKVCAALKWSPRKECLCKPLTSVRKLDFTDERFGTDESEDGNERSGDSQTSNENTKIDPLSRFDFEIDEQPLDVPRRGLRRLKQKFHLKECSVRVKNCVPKNGQDGDSQESSTSNDDCQCSQQQIITRPSPTLMSVKRKVNGNEYQSLLQFHCDMDHVVNRAGDDDLVETYHKSLQEVFPWFDPKRSKISSGSGFSTPTKDYAKDLDSSISKLDDSILETWKEEVLKASKTITTKAGNLYSHHQMDDIRCCALCKGLGDGLETKEDRLLYCGQNEWVHTNCALWSNEVFEEIDGSLQNVHSAIYRGRLIRCSECGKKGASVGCCSKNCSNTFHFPCARSAGLGFNDDKTIFCSLHLANCANKNPQYEDELGVKRLVYVELDRKKKKYVEPEQIKVMIGSLTIDNLGTIVPRFSDTTEKIIPTNYKCSRLYWSTVNPMKLVRYYIRSYVQTCTTEIVVDTEHNITIDHSKEREKEERQKLENLVVKQTLDALIDSVYNREVDENLAEQSNGDLLPPEITDAIFQDLPHDLLDGISMQDIFPKMSYEDFLAMDLRGDGGFGNDLLKDEMLASEDDEMIKSPESKISRVDSTISDLGSQSDLWLTLETKGCAQDFMDDFLNSKGQKVGGKELKRSKSEVISSTNPLLGNTRHHQRSCSLTWSCKLDGTYGPTVKRRKIPRQSPTTARASDANSMIIDSPNDRTPMFHELRIPESIMVTVGRAATPSILSDSVRELKYCLEDPTGLNRRNLSPREDNKDHKRLLWHTRQQPRILQVDGSADASSASECSSPEYNIEERIPQIDGTNDESSCDSSTWFTYKEQSNSISSSCKNIEKHSRECETTNDSFKIPQLDGADDISSDDESPQHVEAETVTYVPVTDFGDRPVTCPRCQCTYRTHDSYSRHLTNCDIVTTSDSDSETMDNKLASPGSTFSDSICSLSPQFITMSPSEGHTLSSEYPDIQVTSPLEASVPSPHPAIQIEPMAQALITPQIHTHATVETVHQTVLTSNDVIVQTQYTRTTTTLPNPAATAVLSPDNTVQITEINDTTVPSEGSITPSGHHETVTSPQISPTIYNGPLTPATIEGAQMSLQSNKLSKPKSPRATKARTKMIKPQIIRNTVPQHVGPVRYQTVQNTTPVLQLQQPQRTAAPTVILQQAPTGIMSAYVETVQQQSGQNLQYITTIGGQEAAYKPQFITTNQLVPGAYIQTASDNLLALPNGGISVLPGVQIAQPQPAVLGTIIQQQPSAIQCGVISSEQLVLSSAPTLEMFTDSTGSMFVSSQPMYYGLETIVSNTVMSSSQFMTGAVPQVLASSYQTTTQVFQASKLMEPIVDVQTVPNVSTVQGITSVPTVQAVQSVPTVAAPQCVSRIPTAVANGSNLHGRYVLMNSTPPESLSAPQMTVQASTNLSAPIEPQNYTRLPVQSISEPVITPQIPEVRPISSYLNMAPRSMSPPPPPPPPPPSRPTPQTLPAIPRVAVRPSTVTHTITQPNYGQWKVTEPLYGVEQTISSSTRPYLDSKHVSENTSMIKSSITSKIPPLSTTHCIPQRDIVNNYTCEVNNTHGTFNSVNLNNQLIPNHGQNKISTSIAPTTRPMNRVLPMQAVTPKQETLKLEINIEEPIKPEIKPVDPEPVIEPMKIVDEIETVEKPFTIEKPFNVDGYFTVEDLLAEKPFIENQIEPLEKLANDEKSEEKLSVPESPKEKSLNTINSISENESTTLNSNEDIEGSKENMKIDVDQDKLQNASLKIVLQKQLQDGSYKITHSMKTKSLPKITSVEILPTKQTPHIASLQLLPIKSFTLKTNKIEEKNSLIDKESNLPKPKTPPVAVKKPRIIVNTNKTPSMKTPIVNTQKKTEPRLMYEIKSQDGFIHTASSMAEVWGTVFQAVQAARKAHNLPPLAHNPLVEDLGLDNNATVYLVEQLAGVNRCVKYKPKFHNLTPLKTPDNDILAESLNGAARAQPFTGRKVHDMFSWLASRHRQQPKMTTVTETEMRRAACTNLPMAMRFRMLKETSKESVGVYYSHIHGRGLFCLRDIEAGEMVIEYAGEVIRASLTDKREKYYDSKHIGCYMFKIDDHVVVDATMKGNAARFINHSCEPNCYSKVVDILGKKHILIFALRRIAQGEELTYDYKFPFEDIKIPCTCGSRRCRKYLN